MENCSNSKKIICHKYSLCGLRRSNEDYIHESVLKSGKCFSFGIFDGHGGNIVSSFLDKNIDKFITSYEDDFKFQFEMLNKYLKYHVPESHLQGSTCLLCLIYSNNKSFRCKIINVGDSRAVGWSSMGISKQTVQLSVDHKPCNFIEKKYIEKLGGKLTFDGYDFRIDGYSLSRVVGDFNSDYLNRTPDIYDYNLDQLDFIILACDGFWDVVTNDIAVAFVLLYCEANPDCCKIPKNEHERTNNIAYLLAKYALDHGSTDNISVMILFIS